MAKEKKSAKNEAVEDREKDTSRPKKNTDRNKREKREKRKMSPDSPLHQIMPILFLALAALFGICIYTNIDMGLFRTLVANLLFGLLGGGAYLVPVWLLLSAARWRADVREDKVLRGQLFGLILIFIVSILCYTFGMPEASASVIKDFYSLGVERVGGGFLGGIFGFALNKLFSKVGTVIITVALFAVFLMLAYGAAIKKYMLMLFRYIAERSEKAKEKRQAEKEAKAADEARARNERVRDSSFYDTLPATVPTDGADKKPSFGGPSQESADRPVVRRFFDAEAANDPAASSAQPVFSNPLPPTQPTERATAPFADDPEIRIVSSRPIPENRANPFGKEKGKPLPFIAEEEEEEEPLEEIKTDTEETDVPPVTVEDMVDDEIPAGGEHSLVINKAHVVEHIGAETLASEEDLGQAKANTFFYSFPPLSLLHEDDELNKEDSDLEIAAKADKLRETLHNFGVAADITCVSRGPRLTRYELVPKPGVRISKIENLVDEITMNLEAISVRIEAPIPGKAAIGVEVPNINTTTVRLRGLLDTDTFRDAPGKTTVCLGVDVVGKPVFADLDKMPHLLVAGATGMGKSVCINSLLISLLYKARPDEVKLILIDPKKVEFQSYANIPHLLVPVVTEPQKAAGALSWAVNEMERRYDLIETAAVRNIVAYNKTVDDHPGRVKMPQIVIVIDELHDLMLQARDAVEDSIARIAAKARAAGILLIIGTQRPSVNVITGVIKANIPSRIAFHVASQVDSRTILDAVGAEKLLNNGDMLFLSPGMKMMTPKRVQGAFLDDDEVNRVADYLRKNSSAVEYDEAVMADMERESEKCNKDKKGAEMGAVENGADMGEDDLFYKAVEVALESGKISTSLLQRRLSLGFGKAARIIDRMCDLGIVSPPNGQKPREVLITADEYRAMRLRHDE